MHHSLSLYPQRLLIPIVLMFPVVFGIPSQVQSSYILNANDIEARRWMSLSPEGRASFVFGFLAGLDHVYESTGLVVTFTSPLSVKELSQKVYNSLVEQPELRSGPIDQIILSALDHVISIKNKSGSRVSPGLKEISTESLRP